MVGDRIYTDMAMARRAGVLAVLVFSGEATAADAAASRPAPIWFLPTSGNSGCCWPRWHRKHDVNQDMGAECDDYER